MENTYLIIHSKGTDTFSANSYIIEGVSPLRSVTFIKNGREVKTFTQVQSILNLTKINEKEKVK
jgi:hypothetical protein